MYDLKPPLIGGGLEGAFELVKYQWDILHDTGIAGWLDDKEEGQYAQLVVQYGVNVAINIGVQMSFAYMFDEQVTNWEQAWNKVSMWQALSDGAVDMISIKKYRYVLSWANNFVQCLANTEGEIKGETIAQCGLLGLVDILVGDAIEKYGMPAVKKGLVKVGINQNKINQLVSEAEAIPSAKAKPTVSKSNPSDDEEKFIGKIKRAKTNGIIYPSVKINGATVVRILEGSNGKIAIIGRKMSYIEEVAEGLKKVGKEVEIFDINKAFSGEGYKDWNLIKSDWDNAIRQFGTFDAIGNKVLPYEKVKQTLWYKENERWARWIKANGFEIYDLGDNPGLLRNEPDRSAFYDLEKIIIFNDGQ